MTFTKDECNKWYDNRLINPKTKRNIRFDGATNEYANIDSKLKRKDFMNNIISMFKKGDVDFQGVYINKKPTTKIINDKPYVL